MGLIQKAYETYVNLQGNAPEDEILPREENSSESVGDVAACIAPVGHTKVKADIDITLDYDGNFVSATAYKGDERNKQIRLIPATETSMSRTGKGAATAPHPLSEQLAFLIPSNEKSYVPYMDQLRRWAKSPFSHRILAPVLKYLEKGTIEEDLKRNGLISYDNGGNLKEKKVQICWAVNFPDRTVYSWKEKSLFKSFKDYYLSLHQEEEQGICMISGAAGYIEKGHPKKVMARVSANAKLMSENDSDNYTYRGRFINPKEALTVSYLASQKAHNTLSWLVEHQGQYIGGRCILVWCPRTIEIDSVTSNFGYEDEEPEEGKETMVVDYKEKLKNSLFKKKEEFEASDEAVVAIMDAMTEGRISVTYYGEFRLYDYLESLADWDEKCSWRWHSKESCTPWLRNIVDFAFGTDRARKGFIETDERVRANYMQTLVVCKLHRAKIPEEVVRNLVRNASMPQRYGKYSTWEDIVFTACAVMKRNMLMKKEGEDIMNWGLDNPDRSFQFGRLLAVMERLELDFLEKDPSAKSKGSDDAGGSDKRKMMTSALRSLDKFTKTPYAVYERTNKHLMTAYYNRVASWQADRYRRLTGEIAEYLSAFSEKELNAPLKGIYLMGYDLQKAAFFKPRKEDKDNKEDKEM